VSVGNFLNFAELVPQTVSAVQAERELLFQAGLHKLHVVVEHRDSNDGGQNSYRRDGDAEESEFSEVLGLAG
jgi:hypothetical protein